VSRSTNQRFKSGSNRHRLLFSPKEQCSVGSLQALSFLPQRLSSGFHIGSAHYAAMHVWRKLVYIARLIGRVFHLPSDSAGNSRGRGHAGRGASEPA
jgi:hypothetical protein